MHSSTRVRLGVIVLSLLASGCAPRAAPPASVPSSLATSPHLRLGVPTDTDPSDDVLLDHRVFVVSYNPRLRAPNWVAWRLVAELVI
jgi:DNA/RNA endonuclease G (NUC1)